MTVAATLATAPLIAFHFESLSTMTLVANLLALPAVAPAMWLGMLDRGRRPGARLPGRGPQRARRSAARLHRPGGRLVRPAGLGLPARPLGLGGLVASYAVLAVAGVAIARAAAPASNRRTARAEPGTRACNASERPRAARRCAGRWRRRCGGDSLLRFAPGRAGRRRRWPRLPPAGLRVSVLDVGQGDAILFQPAHAPAVLVDGGPPGDGLAAKLRSAGVERLGVAVVTHEQSDHAGGVEELLGGFPVGRLAYARLSRRLAARPRRRRRAGAGRRGRDAALRAAAGRSPLAAAASCSAAPPAGADPNAQALVLLARWRDFSMLLTADAEAEAVPIDPGPVDVLKVAHHGSDDAGLDALLDRTRPQLAVISVGADNSYGHPTPARSPPWPRTACRPCAPTATARS